MKIMIPKLQLDKLCQSDIIVRTPFQMLYGLLHVILFHQACVVASTRKQKKLSLKTEKE